MTIPSPVMIHFFSRSVSTLRSSSFFPRPPWTPPSNLKYALRPLDPSLQRTSGWTAPMGLIDSSLPFRIFRTPKGKQLPVYTDFKNGRTRCLTIIRRFRGSAEELAEEMSKVCDGRKVDIRPGRIEVNGNYAGRVREWLLRLGF